MMILVQVIATIVMVLGMLVAGVLCQDVATFLQAVIVLVVSIGFVAGIVVGELNRRTSWQHGGKIHRRNTAD